MTSSNASLRTKWEYQGLTRVSEGPLLEALNEAGSEGWELVSAAYYRDMHGTMSWTAILKRPLATNLRPLCSVKPWRVRPSLKSPPRSLPRQAPRRRRRENDFELNVTARHARQAAGTSEAEAGSGQAAHGTFRRFRF